MLDVKLSYFRVIATMAVALMLFARVTGAAERTGEEVYRGTCVRCHGVAGEGVAGKADESLSGNRSVSSLAKVIQRTMPEDEPGTLSVADAEKVAAYIHGAFYSPEARARFKPARIDFSRLTVRQYRNAVADLVGSFRGADALAKAEVGGLTGQYYPSRNLRRDPAYEQLDPRVEFSFGGSTPQPELLPGEEFAVRWRGSVVAEETGDYEFIIKTENGARLWVNDDAERPLIDAWVSSGAEPRESRATVFLLGGRAYPIRVEMFRSREKTASMALRWKPPHGMEGTIPSSHLSPRNVPETMVVTASFPPDDGSAGYERGTSVSKSWDQATTNAAIEVAGYVVKELERLSGTRADAKDREAKLQAFCATFAERAFRRPLTADERTFFAEAPFHGAKDLESGVKRAVLLTLKSPRFLYAEIGTGGAPDPYAVASRLSLGLWDSLPDGTLRDAAKRDELRTEEQVVRQARRMLNDPRARSKVRDFLHHWLETEEASDLSKDPKTYPDFNEQVVSDLRASLDRFLDSVVWDEKSDYRQLLLADYLYLNKRLASFYGVTAPSSGDEFVKVPFDPVQRSGVLTHPFLLSAFAYHKNSSPIHRGVFLTRNVVGRALKPPPAAIEFMDDRFDPSLTMREKVTELTRPAACQGCHVVINPLGFSLENFDAVGRFRTIDNNKPIDPTGDLLTSDGKTIRLTGPRDVARFAATSPEAHAAFIRQLFHYVVKQPEGAYGGDTLERLRAKFVASEFNIQGLIVEIATTAALHGTGAVATAQFPSPGTRGEGSTSDTKPVPSLAGTAGESKP